MISSSKYDRSFRNEEKKLLVSNSIFPRSLSWNYVVLDEGHIIKNAKTKVT